MAANMKYNIQYVKKKCGSEILRFRNCFEFYKYIFISTLPG